MFYFNRIMYYWHVSKIVITDVRNDAKYIGGLLNEEKFND